MPLQLCINSQPIFFGLLDLSHINPFFYYLHIPILIITLSLTALAWYNYRLDRGSKYLAIVLSFLTLHFSLIFITLFFAWVPILMLSWQLLPLTLSLLIISVFVYLYHFLLHQKVSLKIFSYALLPITPILLLLPTSLNINSFNLVECRGVTDSLVFNYAYTYALLILAGVTTLSYQVYKNRALLRQAHENTLLMTIGAPLVLASLILLSYLGNLSQTHQYEIFGLISLLLLLTTSNYQVLNTNKPDGKNLRTFGLGIAIVIMILSIVYNVPIGTLLSTIMLGMLLVYSVRKEVRHTEKIEDLAEKLEQANSRLKVLDKQKSEFVSIASHQLRTPLTSIRGHASLLLEGSYGRVPKKAQDPLTRIEKSSRHMAMAIEDYLNVSQIEAGRMTYKLRDFNLRDEIDNICDDLRVTALKKGLVLIFRSNLNSKGIVNADLGKTLQIIQNIVHNAIKYTPRGNIRVWVRDDVTKKKIYVDIMDTGIGMDKKTMRNIFQKFTRSDNAHQTDINGTGLGLYIALQMAEAMGGTITAHSKGEGEGSHFTVELNLAL